MATSIKYDAQGFPVGELVRSGKDALAEHEMQTSLLRNIRTDVRSIARALGVQVSQARRSMAPAAVAAVARRGEQPGRAVAPAGRSRAEGQASAASSGGAKPGRGSVASQPRQARAAAAAPSVATRDSRGRFVAGGGKAGDGAAAAGAPGGDAPTSTIGATLSRLSDGMNRLSGSISGAESVDANLAAASEVKQAVEPLGRGFSFIFGRNAERKKERWYRRLIDALNMPLWRKKQGDQPPVVVGGGGLFGGRLSTGLAGGVGGLVAGLVSSVLGTIGKLLAGIGGGGRKALGGLLKRGGGLLRRVPILGALLSGGAVLGGLLGLGDDPNASAEENRARRYNGVGQAVGTGAGGLIGGILGSALGPLGTIGGAWLGALIGEKVGGVFGDWTRQLVDSDIPGKVTHAWGVFTAAAGAAWGSFAADAKETWGGVVGKVASWWESAQSLAEKAASSIQSYADAANAWIKEKTGVNLKAKTTEALGAARTAVASAWESAKRAAGEVGLVAKEAAVAAVPETVKRAVRAGAAAAEAASGAISRVVGAGKGYTDLQMADGQVVRREGVRNWRNHNPGNIEYGDFAKRMGAIGSDGRFAIFPDFETGRRAKEALIFEGGSYRGLSLTDAIARYAPPNENNTGAYQRAVLGAVGGANKRMSDYTPAERAAILDAMQRVEGFKVGNVTPLPTVAAGALPSLPSVSIQAPTPPAIPPAPELRDPPTQLNSGARERVVVVQPSADPGQNVSDRGLAHIVTGGIGGS